MTRRPRVIYLIALWWWIAFSSAVLRGIQPQPSLGSTGGEPSTMGSPLYLFAMGLLMWELIALIQLRIMAIWALVGFLGLWSVFLISRLAIALPRNGAAATLMVFYLVINGLVIWYLTSTSFRVVCAQFRRERDEQALKRYADKQIRRDRN